jgi:sortase A
MKLVIRCKQPLKYALRCLEYALVAVAIPVLAYCAFVAIDARVFQAAELRQLDLLLTESRVASAGMLHAGAPARPGSSLLFAAEGLIGRLEIARLGVSVIVIEGSSRTVLRRAAGHIMGTALPGQAGNIGISAHRDTFFRPLRNIRRDDVITITGVNGEYRYRVVSTEVVNPQDVAVLAPSPSEILTLVTCYPFYYIGAAPKRFIVRAQRTS